MKILILTIFLISPFTSVLAQTCQQKLEDAKRAWFNGQLREVETLLSDCLNNELAKDDRFDAYKLMVDAKLLRNEEVDADIYMQKLLGLDPNYQPREVDIAEFKQLYSTYTIRPKFYYGISIGFLIPDYVILYPHSSSGQSVQPAEYEEISGYSLGLNGGMEIYKGIYADLSILISHRSFKMQEEIMGYQTVSAFEKEYYIALPLQIRYVLNFKGIKPFIGGGYSLHYMVNARADIDHWPLDTGLPAFNGFPKSTKAYDLTSQKIAFSHNWILSGGVQYGFGNFLVELNLSYERGQTNLTNAENRYADSELLNTYAYVPDDYKVNTWVVSIKFLRNIARPVKKK